MPSQTKIDYVTALQSSLSQSPNFVLINFGAATHLEIEALRDKLHTLDRSKLTIVKNSLFKVALIKYNRQKKLLAENEESTLLSLLAGPSALLLISGDYLSAIKAVWEFAKNRDDVSFKVGYLDGSLYQTAGLSRLATLPSYEELLVKVIGSLKSPQSRFAMALKFNTNKLVYVLKNIKN